MLTWRELIASLWRLTLLSSRIIFHRKLLFMGLGITVYYGILYAFAVFRPGEGFSTEQALHVLVEIPGTVLAVYLAMDLVARERDGAALEILFSTSMSHYGIWMIRLVAVYAILALTLLAMSTAAYFLFAEFPFVRGGLNAWLPAFLLANLTFFFAVLCRSSNTAGMLALAFILLVLFTWEGLNNTPYFLFLNPFEAPMATNDALWGEKVLLNRLGVVGSGVLFVFLGLRRMELRERLLS
jgi:ABC-type transport system involved in multi-copper enzyme maturation permease subunit